MVELQHPAISTRRQCELLSLNRATLYRPIQMGTETPENLHYMRLIDEEYILAPFYGSRKMREYLMTEGFQVNRKRIQRLMRIMGLEGIAPGPNTSQRNQKHKVYPYLLRNYQIVRPNEVWSTDITYIPMPRGFMYLVAIIDWYSRYVLSWELSNTLDTQFCLDALHSALGKHENPIIFNTDQGCQFTSKEFTSTILDQGIQLSMDGRGRALDNIFVERLWRSVKYECVYLNEFGTVPELHAGLEQYFKFYNERRLHQSLGYKTPKKVHYAA
jgi:putative transposase